MLNEKIKVILDKENIKKANFMGLSLGTLVVSQFAIKYPEYINKLVFIGSVIEVIAFFRFVVAVAVPLRYILPLFHSGTGSQILHRPLWMPNIFLRRLSA